MAWNDENCVLFKFLRLSIFGTNKNGADMRSQEWIHLKENRIVRLQIIIVQGTFGDNFL